MKDVIYVGDSLKVITGFPDKAKQRILTLLDGIKYDVMPHPKEFKYIPAIGMGTYELRVKVNIQYRVFYVTKLKKGIYVLHAFTKKTQKTPKKDIEVGVKRYKAIIEYEG
jgi:phage-related protein